MRELAQRTRFPVAFGGLIDDGVVSVTSIVGNRTRSLDGLRVRPERGLGGRAMMELRPRMTNDYGSSQQITHDYDVFVLGEGLRTLLALPIVVERAPARRALRRRLGRDAGRRGHHRPGDAGRAVDRRGAAHPRRGRAAPALRGPGTDAVPPRQREELRESFAELRSIAASVDDAELRARIAQVERRLRDARRRMPPASDRTDPHRAPLPP